MYRRLWGAGRSPAGRRALRLAVVLVAALIVVAGLAYLSPQGRQTRQVRTALRAREYEAALKLYTSAFEKPGGNPLRRLNAWVARRELQASGRSLRVTPGHRAEANVAIRMIKTGPWPGSWPEARLRRHVRGLLQKNQYAQALDAYDGALKQTVKPEKEAPSPDAPPGPPPAVPVGSPGDPGPPPPPPMADDASAPEPDAPAAEPEPEAPSGPRTVSLFGRTMFQQNPGPAAADTKEATGPRLPFTPEALADVATDLRAPGCKLALSARDANEAITALRMMRGGVPQAKSKEEIEAYIAVLNTVITSGTDQQVEQAVEVVQADSVLLNLAFHTGADVSWSFASYGGTEMPGPPMGESAPDPAFAPAAAPLDLDLGGNQAIYALVGKFPAYAPVRQAALKRLYGPPAPERDETMYALVEAMGKATWQKAVESASRRAKQNIMARRGAARVAALAGTDGRLIGVCLGADDGHNAVSSQLGTWVVSQAYGPVLRAGIQAGEVSASRAAIGRLKSVGVIYKGNLPTVPGRVSGPAPGAGKGTWPISLSDSQSGDWSYDGSLRVPDAFLVVRGGTQTAFRRLYSGGGVIYYADYQTSIRRAALIRSSDLAVLWARTFKYTPQVQSRVSLDDIAGGTYYGDSDRVVRQLDNALGALLGH